MKLLFLLFLFFFSYCAYAQEICDNSKDDDGDGLIDLRDPDCQCQLKAAQNLLQNASFEFFRHCPVEPYHYSDNYDIPYNWQYGVKPDGEVYFHHTLSCPLDSLQFMYSRPPQLPLPDGKAFISILQDNTSVSSENTVRKSYVAQCLQVPLLKGGDYTFTFYGGRFKPTNVDYFQPNPFTVGVFGHADCNAVPFGGDNTMERGCPANYDGWVLLGKARVYSKDEWVQVKIHLTIPKDINVIEIGPDCSLPPVGGGITTGDDGDEPPYYLDDLQLAETKDFTLKYITLQSGSPCAGNYVLKAPEQAGAGYQWYHDSIAIAGATDIIYQVPQGEQGNYNVRLSYGSSCTIAETFAVGLSNLYKLRLPADTFFCSTDTLLLAPPTKGVSYSWNGRTDTAVRLAEGGLYNITATDTFGCKRSFSVKADKQDCKNCTVLLPSAFTPNDDGINDVLKAYINCGVSSFNLQIYNRWGQRLFESSNLSQGWDGTYKKVKVPFGAYIYVIYYKTLSSVVDSKVLKGTVTVLY